MCRALEAGSAPLWLQFLALDRLVRSQCVLVGRDPAFDNFLPKINSMWYISGATMLILALRPESCITLIAIGEAQKIMNRNSSQSCTLSSGEIGEYISTVTVLLACSKEYLTLLAPAT